MPPAAAQSAAVRSLAAATPIADDARDRTTCPFAHRFVALAVSIVSAGVLILAATLSPATGGLGTHTQLSMPACGWVERMDLPCPTCGMTTSFAYAADGDLFQSFVAQPLGLVLALITAMAMLIGLHIATTGSRLGSRLVQLWRPRTLWIFSIALLAAWGFKILSFKGVIG